VYAQASLRPGLQVELVDLRDCPLPFFEGHRASPIAAAWAQRVSQADGYVLVTPEYNHSFPAVLKNALDHAYAEWNNKPAAIVSYSAGPAAGIRAVEQLRLVAVELRTAPLREAVHLPHVASAFADDGQPWDAGHVRQLDALLEELVWWARTLKVAREATPVPA
jgi:NAD(P)H-dependent FMN reductase